MAPDTPATDNIFKKGLRKNGILTIIITKLRRELSQ
jgi:hypothetical protein